MTVVIGRKVGVVVAGVVSALLVTTPANAEILGSGPTKGGTSVDLPVPEVLFSDIASGVWHSVGVASDGDLYTWGYNYNGQLGDGTQSSRSTPKRIELPGLAAGERVAQIATGTQHSLALTSAGNVYAWGDNDRGAIGDGTSNNVRRTPVKVELAGLAAGEKVIQVTSRQESSLALTSVGSVYGWGVNGNGQLGDGTTESRLTPVKAQLSGLSDGVRITQLAAGGAHTLALASDNSVYGWGFNQMGQLGNNSPGGDLGLGQSLPVRADLSNVGNGAHITQLAAGEDHSLALASDGNVYAWGFGDSGALGNGTSADQHLPTKMPLAGAKATDIAAGLHTSLVLSDDNAIYGTGFNNEGQLGNGSTSGPVRTPVKADLSRLDGAKVTRIATGSVASMALTSGGAIYGWGFNDDGQIGNGSTQDERIPTRAISPFLTVAAVGFGGTPAASFAQTAGSLNTITPPHSSGLVDIVVGYTNGTSTTYPDGFFYGAAPDVILQPTSVTIAQASVEAGTAVTFTADATGDETPTVIWQTSTDGGTTWTTVANADAYTVSIPATQLTDGGLYRAVFTNPLGSATTDPARVTLTGQSTPPTSVAPTPGPGNTTTPPGNAENAPADDTLASTGSATTVPLVLALVALLASGLALAAHRRHVRSHPRAS